MRGAGRRARSFGPLRDALSSRRHAGRARECSARSRSARGGAPARRATRVMRVTLSSYGERAGIIEVPEELRVSPSQTAAIARAIAGAARDAFPRADVVVGGEAVLVEPFPGEAPIHDVGL